MKKFLFALITILALPLEARATVTADLLCEAQISLRDGTRLTYTIAGGLELADSGQIVSSSLQDPNLFITIVRRERNGRERLLRSEERLGNWFYDAPDSTLAIPFSRSLPSSTTEVFHVRSADHGIYIGMRTSTPIQIQVVHYLTRNRTVTSNISNCSLQSQ